MKVLKIITCLHFMFYIVLANNTNHLSYWLQNPPQKIKYYSELDYINIAIEEVDFARKLRAYYSCRHEDNPSKNCYKYIRNRYFDFKINRNIDLSIEH